MLAQTNLINWRRKAATQRLLSRIPCGEQLNYLLSKYVTRHLPPSEATFRRDVSFAKQYLEAFRKFGSRAVEHSTFYEFGVGWDLTVALAFYSLGVNRQIVVDLRRLLKPSLLAMTAARLNRLAGESGGMRLLPELEKPMGTRLLIETLSNNYGIDYRAPFDARNSGLESGSIDCITSTKVLCHIPEHDLGLIMGECNRLLRADGLAAFVIDYRDQYSYSDRTIGPYNFLQFSDAQWAYFNPSLHYQNRMRHSDYARVFKQTGFEPLVEVGAPPDHETGQVFDRIALALRFASYDPWDLKLVRGEFVLKKLEGTVDGTGAR